MTVSITYHSHVKKTANQIPRMWGRRLDFLKKFFKAPELQNYRPWAEHVLNGAVVIEQARTFIVHGMLIDYKADQDHLLVWGKVDTHREHTAHKLDGYPITFKRLLELVNSSHEVAADLTKLNHSLANALVAK